MLYDGDILTYFNTNADYEYEIYGSFSIGAIAATAFFVPKQSSTDNNLNSSDYWIEFSGNHSLYGADLSATLGYGTYSSKFLGEKDAVSYIQFSASRSASETLSVNWNYLIGLSHPVDDLFWLGCSIEF